MEMTRLINAHAHTPVAFHNNSRWTASCKIHFSNNSLLATHPLLISRYRHSKYCLSTARLHFPRKPMQRNSSPEELINLKQFWNPCREQREPIITSLTFPQAFRSFLDPYLRLPQFGCCGRLVQAYGKLEKVCWLPQIPVVYIKSVTEPTNRWI